MTYSSWVQVAVHGEWGTVHKGVHAVASVAHHSNHAFCLGRELIFGSGGIGLGRDDGGGAGGVHSAACSQT